MRRCHRCDEIYHTEGRFSKICDNCKIHYDRKKIKENGKFPEAKTTPEQIAAQKKWREKNRGKVNTYSRKYYFEKQGE